MAVKERADGYPTRRRFFRSAVCCFAASTISGICVWRLAWEYSPTIDEPAHLAAAITAIKHGRFDLYAVNPPLTRLIAGLAARPSAGWKDDILDQQCRARPAVAIRQEFSVGEHLFDMNGLDAWRLLYAARCCGIAYVVIGAIGCSFWAFELGGERASILAAVLWCAEPSIMGHGALITPDVALATLSVWAGYFLWRWLKVPSVHRAAAAGFFLGAATLTKFTAILYWPCWALTAFVWSCRRSGNCTRVSDKDATSIRYGIITILALAWMVILLGYGADGLMVPLRQYQFSSQWLSSDTTNSRIVGNRFQHNCLGHVPIPLPYDMVQGIDAQQADFERSWRCYLCGTWKENGWWYFYVYALAVKLPLGTLFLMLWSLTPCIGARLNWRDAMVLLAPALLIIVVLSTKTRMTVHSRYLIPALPFAIVHASQLVADGLAFSRTRWSVAFLATAMVVVSSALAFPDPLSYFNEAAGGVRNGSRHLLDSNIDWGQDLRRVKRWLDEHPSAHPTYLAAYSTVDPRVIGIDFTLPPIVTSTRNETDVTSGRYIVSVNFLRGANFSAPDGKGGRYFIVGNRFHELIHRRPIDYIGGAFVVYDVK